MNFSSHVFVWKFKNVYGFVKNYIGKYVLGSSETCPNNFCRFFPDV